MLTEHARKHALGVWRFYGRALRGRLCLYRGSAAEGAALLRSALAELADTPLDIRFQLYLVWLAETLVVAGDAAAALTAIDEALERAERTEERWYLPELLRIRGELLLQAGAPEANAGAHACFERSLQLARAHGVLSWELRTTMSVVRHRGLELGRAALHDMLGAVLARFSEGFATGDLVQAKMLRDELAS
jgi:predicted ATPase